MIPSVSFTVNSKKFADCCLFVSNATIDAKSSLPLLNNFKIAVGHQTLTVAATDLTLTITAQCEAVVSQSGTLTLDAMRLVSLLKEVTSETIEVILPQSGVFAFLYTGSAIIKLYCGSPLGFPPERIPIASSPLVIQMADLRDSLRCVRFATDTPSSGTCMSGIKLEVGGGVVRFISSDCRRIAISEIPCKTTHLDSCILPYKAIDVLARTSHLTGAVYIEITKNSVYFVAENGRVTTQRLEGCYPEYREGLPSRQPQAIHIDTNLLGRALRRAISVQEKVTPVVLTITSNKLKVSLVSADIGEAEETINIENPHNVIATIAINPRYLLDIIPFIKTPTMPVDIHDAKSAIVINALPRLFYLLMPVCLD